jgi:hypothetical protein
MSKQKHSDLVQMFYIETKMFRFSTDVLYQNKNVQV